MSTTRDPVCGMEVDTETAVRLEHGSHVHYFCAEACRAKFVADPALYGDVHTLRIDPNFTVGKHGMTAPKWGAAGSGGLEYEPLPPGVKD
jgi:YHS domain-containing protein